MPTYKIYIHRHIACIGSSNPKPRPSIIRERIGAFCFLRPTLFGGFLIIAKNWVLSLVVHWSTSLAWWLLITRLLISPFCCLRGKIQIVTEKFFEQVSLNFDFSHGLIPVYLHVLFIVYLSYVHLNSVSVFSLRSVYCVHCTLYIHTNYVIVHNKYKLNGNRTFSNNSQTICFPLSRRSAFAMHLPWPSIYAVSNEWVWVNKWLTCDVMTIVVLDGVVNRTAAFSRVSQFLHDSTFCGKFTNLIQSDFILFFRNRLRLEALAQPIASVEPSKVDWMPSTTFSGMPVHYEMLVSHSPPVFSHSPPTGFLSDYGPSINR